MDLIELCRQSIAIDSTPAHGNKEIIAWAADYCQKKGFHVEVHSEYFGDLEHQNLIIRTTSERSNSEFLMQNHLDTVDPGPFPLWQDTFHNPFEATIKDGKIFGLGAADGKIDFICKVEALSQFIKTDFRKLQPVIAVTFGAHLGMIGALKLIRKNKISAKMALIGEATGMQLIHAAPGYASVEIRIPFSEDEIRHKQDHDLRESTSSQSKLFSIRSGTSEVNESAIRKMFEYLLQLPESLLIIEIDGGSHAGTQATNAFLELDLSSTPDPISKKLVSIYQFIKSLELEFQTYEDTDFSPSHPTLNIGLIRTLEDHVMISGSCRIPPVVTHKTYEDWMLRMKIHCEKVGVNFRVADYKKPFRTNEKSALVRGCLDELKKMSLSEKICRKNSTNEASLFSRVGIECVCFGPGLSEDNVHTPHEHVLVADIECTIQFYKK